MLLRLRQMREEDRPGGRSFLFRVFFVEVGEHFGLRDAEGEAEAGQFIVGDEAEVVSILLMLRWSRLTFMTCIFAASWFWVRPRFWRKYRRFL